MKTRINPFVRPTALTASIVLALATASHGQTTYYWDGGTTDIAGNGNAASNGAAGTWNTTLKNWDVGSSALRTAWVNDLTNTAVLAGAGGTVNVSGTIQLGTLNAQNTGSTGYTLAGGTLDFGSNGIITTTGASNQTTIISSLLKGKITFTPQGGTLSSASSFRITNNNVDLTETVLNGANANTNILIENAGSLGAATATVKLTRGVLNLGNNAGSSPTYSPVSYNAWATELAGGTIRGRLGFSTWNGATNVTANSTLTTRASVDSRLTFSNTGTINLNTNTLTLTAASASSGIILNGVISGSGNLVLSPDGLTGGANGTGTVTLGAANTFSGNATTPQNLGTLALNNVNALQNATLDTGLSGTQAVTFTAAGTTYNIGAITGSDAIAIGANTISVGTKAADTTFAADISGAGGGLTKVGSNKLTLTASNTFTGATNITGGSLALTGAGAVNSSSGITINGSGAKLLHTGNTAISSAVTLTNGTVTGSGTINTVNVGAGTGGIISNNDGVSGSALTIGTLTLAGGASIDLYSNTTAAALNVTTLTNNSAANEVTLTANNLGGWTNGLTYHIIDYSTLTGAGAYNFNKVVNNKSARQSETWTDDTANGIITLAITGDNPRWMGDGDGKWNLSSANNWKLITGGNYTNFLATDDLIFDDNATGTSSIDIDAANVAPNTTIFNNTTAKAYTLGSSGGFGISSGNLTKNNDGSLTISSNNTYSGPTTLNAGLVTLAGAGTLGSTSALTMSGGQLDLGDSNQSFSTVSITAPAASGSTLSNGSLTATSYAVSNSTGNVGISANLFANGAAGFTKSGAGTTTLSGTNTYTGTTAINAGSLILSGAGTLGNGAALTLGGGSLDLGTLSRTVGAVSITTAAASGDTISNGSLTGTSYAASNASGNAIISANLLASGAAGFTKSGAGTTTLSGTNTYTGATAISAGTVKAGSATAFNNSSALNMSGTGTLDLAGNHGSFTSSTSAATNTITTSGAGSGTDVLTVSALASDTAASALFTDNGTRKLQVNLTGSASGSWQATSNINNTYSGGLILNGTMRAAVLGGTVGTPGAITSGQFGTGSITVNGSSQIQIAASSRTLVNDVIVNGNAGNGSRPGTFRIGTNSSAVTGLVISGNITANLAEAQFGADPTSGGSTLLLSGKLTGNNGFRFFSSNNNQAWTTTFNNATASPNDYNGNTTISSSLTTLALGASNQIPNGAGKGNVNLTSGFLDLAGFDETINGLSGAGTVDNVTSGTANTLTIGDGNTTNQTFSGLIKNTTGTLSLTKIGSGTQTLSGANTFTGGLTVKHGTLLASTLNTALGGSSAGVANGLGTVTLGDTSGSNDASLLVSSTGLNFANPIALATNGNLTLGNTGAAISTTFSGGITGSNDLTILSNSTTGTIGLTTAAINHTGKITNTGAGNGTTTISSSIGSNVTEVIGSSATSALLLTGNNTAFAGNYSVNSGRMAIATGFAANAASAFNLGSTTSGNTNTTLSFVNNFAISNDINVRSGNSGTKTLGLGTSADLTSSFSGTFTLDDDLILDASGTSAAASLTVSGNIKAGTSGAKGLTKNGAGLVTLSGTASDFTGDVSINSGELRIANANALGASTTITVGATNNSGMSLTGGITLGSGKEIKIKGGGLGGFFGALSTATNNSGTSEWQGSVTIDALTGTRIGSQAGILNISGNIGQSTEGSQLVIRNSNGGITILSGTNSHTGETTINSSGGELRVSGGSAIHNSGVVNVVNSAGNVFRISGSETIGSLTGGGNTNAKVAIESNQTLTLASGSQTFAGIIEGSGALTVNGASQTLTNTNTYSGNTTIAAGTLALSTTGSINNSALIDVQDAGTLSIAGVTASTTVGGASAQTLKGLGSVNLGDKTLTIGGAGTLAPGASPGTLEFVSTGGKLDFAADSTVTFELGTLSDLISFSTVGDWLTGSGNADLSLNLLSGFDYANTYTIFQNVNTSGFTFNTITGYDSTGYAANFTQNGTDYDLSFTIIPEPSSALLSGLASLLLLRRRRTAA